MGGWGGGGGFAALNPPYVFFKTIAKGTEAQGVRGPIVFLSVPPRLSVLCDECAPIAGLALSNRPSMRVSKATCGVGMRELKVGRVWRVGILRFKQPEKHDRAGER